MGKRYASSGKAGGVLRHSSSERQAEKPAGSVGVAHKLSRSPNRNLGMKVRNVGFADVEMGAAKVDDGSLTCLLNARGST